MSSSSWLFLVGTVFILMGIGFFIWGMKEASSYRYALAQRYDLREFITHIPKRPEPGALKIGGVISVVVGFFMIIAGILVIVWT